MLGVVAVWAVLLPVLHMAEVPAATLRTGVVLVIQPLWFIAVYLLTALTPWCVRAALAFGGRSAVPLIGIGLLASSSAASKRPGPASESSARP